MAQSIPCSGMLHPSTYNISTSIQFLPWVSERPSTKFYWTLLSLLILSYLLLSLSSASPIPLPSTLPHLPDLFPTLCMPSSLPTIIPSLLVLLSLMLYLYLLSPFLPLLPPLLPYITTPSHLIASVGQDPHMIPTMNLNPYLRKLVKLWKY